ncbi:gastrula zinc finger protein 5-1-like [Syngnathoides biaculeatus]|uniref:gastrula zinc finger protein 5-1-like n=1 Tax=Syngnathoides biaculeatus TaxID=300417 RepID=UPI002ADD4D23|nr:gastrula zinc finger protein 5-1-like [Syngnathoides biaculeatus]
MCKVEMLRALLNARLSAALDEIFALFERTLAEYEDELCRTKDENERQRRLLDAVFVSQDEAHGPDIHEEYLYSEHPTPELPHIKEEEEPETFHVKEEEEEADIVTFQCTGAPSESQAEDKGQCEEYRGMAPPSSSSSSSNNSSSQDMTAEGHGDQRGGPRADGLLAPLSDSDDVRSHSADTDGERSKDEMRRHTYNKRVKCSQCDNTFFNKSSLKRHMTTHTGVKPFACSVCGKRFRIKGDLKIHTRIHTGEKPFACSFCDKEFTQKGHLRSHMRTHTGEKPFACSFCNLSFSQRSSLVPHMRTHTGEKPYSCSTCGKSFSLHVNLVRHRSTHADEKAFSCRACDEQFSTVSELDKHTC